MTFEHCLCVCPPLISLTEQTCCGHTLPGRWEVRTRGAFILQTQLPESLHLYLQDLRHSLQLPKNPRKSMRLTNLPLPRELRLGLSSSYIETFVHHDRLSDVVGNYPMSYAKGTNLSRLVGCSPRSCGGPAWPRYRLAWAARCLISKPHIFRPVDLLRPAPASVFCPSRRKLRCCSMWKSTVAAFRLFSSLKWSQFLIVLGIRITNSTCPCSCFDLALSFVLE